MAAEGKNKIEVVWHPAGPLKIQIDDKGVTLIQNSVERGESVIFIPHQAFDRMRRLLVALQDAQSHLYYANHPTEEK